MRYFLIQNLAGHRSWLLLDNIIRWFYEDLSFINLSKNSIEKTVLEKLSTIEEIWKYVKELEAEAYYKIMDIESSRDNVSTYIDLMILMDTIIVRYVELDHNGINDIEYYTLMLGEIKIASPKIKHEHTHRHDDIGGTINWYKDMIDYLKITNKEIIEYSELVNNNVKRILEAKNHSMMTPNTVFLIILKGWSVENIQVT